MAVLIRKETPSAVELRARLKMPAPMLFPGEVVRCTNTNASEFTHCQCYRIERLAHNAQGGPALAVVRNDAGELRMLTSLSWAFKHWEVSYG